MTSLPGSWEEEVASIWLHQMAVKKGLAVNFVAFFRKSLFEMVSMLSRKRQVLQLSTYLFVLVYL